MSSTSGESSNDSTLQLIAKKIRSQFLLFCIAIALVIVTVIQTAGVDAGLPVGAILIVFFVGALVYSFVDRDRDSPAASTVLEEVPNSVGGDLRVEVWVKDAKTGQVSDEFRLGDQVRVCVKATQDCYLTLLNVASDGELTILFPNQHNQNNRIQGGTTNEIPSDGYGFNIVLEEPAGIDRLKAIVTLDPKPLIRTQFNAEGEFFQSVEATAVPRAMKVVAAEVKKLDDKLWAAASTQFDVKPK